MFHLWFAVHLGRNWCCQPSRQVWDPLQQRPVLQWLMIIRRSCQERRTCFDATTYLARTKLSSGRSHYTCRNSFPSQDEFIFYSTRIMVVFPNTINMMFVPRSHCLLPAFPCACSTSSSMARREWECERWCRIMKRKGNNNADGSIKKSHDFAERE